jgi:fatty acid desaturase
LWALFLILQGNVIEFCLMIAFLAVINPVVAFYDIRHGRNSRSLILLYVIVLLGMLWATYLLVMGVQLWFSLLIFIVCIGVPTILHVMKIESEPVKNDG